MIRSIPCFGRGPACAVAIIPAKTHTVRHMVNPNADRHALGQAYQGEDRAYWSDEASGIAIPNGALNARQSNEA
jgi:hypothetical protein